MTNSAITTLENSEYAPPTPGNPDGGAGTGPRLTLGTRNDTVIGTLGQLKGSHIDGGAGFNIFQVNDTPSPVMGAMVDTEMEYLYNTIDSARLLNSLVNFQEIDFNGHAGRSDYYGLDWEREFQVDASTLHVKTLGVLANNEDVTFANLSSKNLVIAKLGDDAVNRGEQITFLNLEAAREVSRNLNPFEQSRDSSGGWLEHGPRAGVVHLQVNAGVTAVVTENEGGRVDGSTDSDYQWLVLSGAGDVQVANVANSNQSNDSPGPRNNNIQIDGRALTGSLYVQNDSYVIENIVFTGRSSSSTNLVGSTFGQMDTVRNVTAGDLINVSGTNTVPQSNDNDMALPDNSVTTLRLGGTLQSEFAQADAYSEAHNTVVCFVGSDGNTYLWDRAVAPSSPQAIDALDFVIKIIGVHSVSSDGHILS